MSSPALSVLLPVHNAERYLDTCLRSLLRQTFTDFEIVAVDDGSVDRSAAVLARWAQRDSRLRVLARPHAGLIAALNHGLGACRGDLVARMDADDASLPQRFAKQIDALERAPRLDVVSCWVRHVRRPDVGDGMRRYESWLNSLTTHHEIVRERFVESPLAHPSAMVRRHTLQAVAGYLDRGWPEDYDLWLRLAAGGARFAKVPEVLYFWRDHGTRLTRADHRYRIDRFLACKAHYLATGPLAGIPRVILWGAGLTAKRLCRYLLREGVSVVACLDISPKRFGGTLRGIPVYDAEQLPTLWRTDGSTVVVTAVAARGARALIRARLNAWNLVEGRCYWCAA